MQSSSIKILLYEPWMRSQIIELTEKQYPFMSGWFEKRFNALHESEYQKNKNKIVVAVADDNKVVATISYITWPVSFNGKLLNSHQMVGLIVDESLRGKGIFRKVLEKLDDEMKLLNSDVVLGYPVVASKAGFVKQGWNNLFDLTWHLSIVNIFAFIKNVKFNNKIFKSGTPEIAACDNYLQTASDQSFWNLRENFSPDDETFHQNYLVDGNNIQIIFRIQQKSKFKIAVIGKIYAGNATEIHIKQAIKFWKKDLRKNGGVMMAGATINEHCNAPSISAVKNTFHKIPKKIHVIVKSYTKHPEVMRADNWNLMMGDMETW